MLKRERQIRTSQQLDPAIAPYLVRSIATILASFLVATACGGDDDGSIDTSNTSYCQEYSEVCTEDSLRKIKSSACEDECANGVIVAAKSVRQSVCWKLVCSLELGICQEYSDELEGEDPYTEAIVKCAKDHGWYEPLSGEE